jgi:RNA polymerase sigma-70 factor (ECF subfamily)
LDPRLEQHRRELTRYCGRVLGSAFEAEDAVQETLLRAWRNLDRFEARATLRSWLYRIATNVCADMMRRPQRRARPMDLGPANDGDVAFGASGGDPAEEAATRESILLALVVLERLPPRQRTVLILREVLRWRADEVAELLGWSVASVNSALQRARSALANGNSAMVQDSSCGTVGAAQRRRLARCVDAFGRADLESLVSLLHDE